MTETVTKKTQADKFIVLLVDDEEDILEYVNDVLSDRYHVLTARMAPKL